MTGALTIDLWKLAFGAVLFVLGLGGFIIAVLRWQLDSLRKGQGVLFDLVNGHSIKLNKIEKAIVKIDPSQTQILRL